MELVRRAQMRKIGFANRFVTFLLMVGVDAGAAAQSSTVPSTPQLAQAGAATLLETLSWDEAERLLTPETVVVIPLGAESKEHGRHLQLNNDFLMAGYFKQRVLAASGQKVVIAPT